MSAKINLTGKSFGHLIVLSENGRHRKEAAWLCLCECGTEITLPGFRLRSGQTKSCGCLRNELIRKATTVHGRADTKGSWRIWIDMRRRCERPNDSAFPRYGGRGIKVCERWSVFANFLEDMGEHPPGMTLDRIDNNGNYEPSNCRWTTYSRNNRNKRNNHLLTIGDITRCIADWSDASGIAARTIWRRISLGWPSEAAVWQPTSLRCSA